MRGIFLTKACLHKVAYAATGELRIMPIHSALQSTVFMLKKSLETGISEEEYYVLLYLLYEYMSDRNLAIVMENLTKKSR